MKITSKLRWLHRAHFGRSSRWLSPCRRGRKRKNVSPSWSATALTRRARSPHLPMTRPYCPDLAGGWFRCDRRARSRWRILRAAFKDFLDKAQASGPTPWPSCISPLRPSAQWRQLFCPVDAKIASAQDVAIEALRISDIQGGLTGFPQGEFDRPRRGEGVSFREVRSALGRRLGACRRRTKHARCFQRDARHRCAQ